MNDNLKSAVVFVAGLAIGSAVTYAVVNKRLSKKYFDLANEEIESVKDTYKLLRKEPPYDDPRTAVAAYAERLDELDYLNQHPEELDEAPETDTVEAEDTMIVEENDPEPKLEQHNLFDDAAEEGDTHVISQELFYEGVENFESTTLTYYDEDDTLTDERGSIVSDPTYILGDTDALSRFGENSGNPDTVYVRNPWLQMDVEIIRTDSSYTKDVLGIDDEEPKKNKIKKMRDDD